MPSNRLIGETSGGLRKGNFQTMTRRTEDGKGVLLTYTLTRTDRPYIYDLCDAYNEARTPEEIDRGYSWYIDGEQVKLDPGRGDRHD